MDKDYKILWVESVKENQNLKSENDCFKQGITSKNDRIDELKGDIIALNNDIIKMTNENQELNKAIDFKNNCFYELNDKHIELGKENKNLLEIIDNYRKGIENSNIELSESKGIEEKLKTEIINLRQTLKAMAYLL